MQKIISNWVGILLTHSRFFVYDQSPISVFTEWNYIFLHEPRLEKVRRHTSVWEKMCWNMAGIRVKDWGPNNNHQPLKFGCKKSCQIGLEYYSLIVGFLYMTKVRYQCLQNEIIFFSTNHDLGKWEDILVCEKKCVGIWPVFV